MPITRTNASATIGDLRRAAGITQQTLAERSACSIGYVRMLEAGAIPARSAVLPRVLAVLIDHDPPVPDEPVIAADGLRLTG